MAPDLGLVALGASKPYVVGAKNGCGERKGKEDDIASRVKPSLFAADGTASDCLACQCCLRLVTSISRLLEAAQDLHLKPGTSSQFYNLTIFTTSQSAFPKINSIRLTIRAPKSTLDDVYLRPTTADARLQGRTRSRS